MLAQSGYHIVLIASGKKKNHEENEAKIQRKIDSKTLKFPISARVKRVDWRKIYSPNVCFIG